MESETVFTVTVGYCLLQPGIQPDYVVGDVTKLVMRKRFGIEDAFSPLCTFGKTVEPLDVMPDAPGSKEPDYAHYNCHRNHNPKESIIGCKDLEWNGIWHCRPHYISVTEFGSIEICTSRTFAMSAQCVSFTISHGFGYFLPVKMVCAGE